VEVSIASVRLWKSAPAPSIFSRVTSRSLNERESRSSFHTRRRRRPCVDARADDAAPGDPSAPGRFRLKDPFAPGSLKGTDLKSGILILVSLSEGDCTEYQESAAPPELAACKAA